MRALKTKIRQIQYWLKHNFLTAENIVLLCAIVICIVCTYQSVVSMSRNWELSERLTEEKKSLELVAMEAEMKELENEYLASNEYQELLARKMLDKQLPGENMVVMPDNSEQAKTKHQERESTTKPEVKEYSNFEKWMMYLFPRY